MLPAFVRQKARNARLPIKKKKKTSNLALTCSSLRKYTEPPTTQANVSCYPAWGGWTAPTENGELPWCHSQSPLSCGTVYFLRQGSRNGWLESWGFCIFPHGCIYEPTQSTHKNNSNYSIKSINELNILLTFLKKTFDFVDLHLEKLRFRWPFFSIFWINWTDSIIPVTQSINSITYFMKTNWLNHQSSRLEKELNQFNQFCRKKWINSNQSTQSSWLVHQSGHELGRKRGGGLSRSSSAEYPAGRGLKVKNGWFRTFMRYPRSCYINAGRLLMLTSLEFYPDRRCKIAGSFNPILRTTYVKAAFEQPDFL